MSTQRLLITSFADGSASDGGSDAAAALRQAEAHHGWIWIDVTSRRPEAKPGRVPSQESWHRLAEQLGLNRLAVEDMDEQSQRTKLERYGEHAFMVLHPATFRRGTHQVLLGEMDVYLGHSFILTHRSGESLPVTAAKERVMASPVLSALGPRGAGYALLDEVVDGYQPVLEALSQDIDAIDNDLFSRSENDVASRIYRLSRQVSLFQRAVSPLDPVLTAARKALAGEDPALLLGASEESSSENWAHDFASEPSSGTSKDKEHHRRRTLLEALLRDVQDHARRVESHAAEMHSTLSNALSLAMTLAAERSTEVSLEQNDQTKKVSSWAAIIAAPAVLAGVWGMNFKYMPELDLTWGYPAALVTMVGSCVGLYLAFKRKDWL